MFDFLNPQLLPKVSTTAISSDNYEVANLISEDYNTKSRGFIAYSTVKPPIEITFELICPINIHYIYLITSLGNQKCTAIEILSKKYSENFVSIGYAKYDSNEIVFCNRKFYSIHNPPPNNKNAYLLQFFKANSYKSFTAANFVKVRILQTTRSVPCLGKIEIWGKPSKLCSVTTLNSVMRLMKTENSSSVEKLPTKPKKPLLDKDVEIPEEFIDQLTFEVMSIPLTLPSGKTVDKSTLEKYLTNEASYGRPATDPFTSLVFTEVRKPLLNSALKSRIDMFLLQHSEDPTTFSIARTLGKRAPSQEIIDESIHCKKTKIDVNEPHSSNIVPKHPDELLQEAIDRTMNSKEFVKFTGDEEHELQTNQYCSKCNITINLYVVPCNHLYCRNCLLSMCSKMNCCFVCNKLFVKKDAKKFHL